MIHSLPMAPSCDPLFMHDHLTLLTGTSTLFTHVHPAALPPLLCPQALAEVVLSRSDVQMMLEGSDYAGALELLEHLQHAMDSLSGVGVTTLGAAGPQVGALKVNMR